MKFENVTVVLVLALRSQIIHLAELWAEEGGSAGSADPWRQYSLGLGTSQVSCCCCLLSIC